MQNSDIPSVTEKTTGPAPAKPGAGIPANPANPEKTKKSGGMLWVVLLIVAVVIGVVVWRARQAKAAAAAAAPKRGDLSVPITPGTVQRKSVPIYLDGLGTVQAFNAVSVTPRVDGQLIKVAFTEGQDVHTNDLLAQIDPGPYQAALEQAKAKKAQDLTQLENDKVDLQRDQQLTNIVTEQALATQQSLVRKDEAAVQADQAGMDSAQVQLNYTTITAPLEGRCGLRLIDQGNIVRASDTNALVVITQLRPISVVFTLPEQRVQVVSAKFAQGPVKVLAVGRDNKTVLDEGTLAVIDNQIDVTTGTIKLKATFPNEKLRLWPGQFVNPRVLVDETNGLVVGENVIQRGPDGEYVFTINGQGTNMTAKLTPVQVAQMEDDLALIASGLTEGQRVVVDGQYRLEDGTKITISTNSPAGGSGAPGRGGRSGGGTNQPPTNQPPRATGV